MPSKFCSLCGKPLTGMVHVLRHPRWTDGQALRICTTCSRERARCQVCGMPLAEAAGEQACPTCQAFAPRCLACGQLVRGRALVVDGVGPYCEDCHRSRPPCDTCGAPLTDERWLLSDGRVLCARCHQTAVYAPEEASALYAEVQQVIAARLGLRLNIPTGLALVDRNQLAEILRTQADPDQALEPAQTLGIYMRRGTRRGMYAQTGLPEIELIHVVAHEYAHAWQGENCPLLRDPLLREGFAEWVAYHVLAYYRHEQRMLAMRRRPEDIYRQGLEAMLALEAQSGQAAVIEACRSSGRVSQAATTGGRR